MSELQEITTRTTILRLRPDNIIECRGRLEWSGTQDIDDAREIVQAVEQLSQGQQLPLITYMTNNPVNREARNFYTQCKQLSFAIGLVANNPFQRVVAAMFIGLTKTVVPTKVFSTEEIAIIWLKAVVENPQLLK